MFWKIQLAVLKRILSLQPIVDETYPRTWKKVFTLFSMQTNIFSNNLARSIRRIRTRLKKHWLKLWERRPRPKKEKKATRAKHDVDMKIAVCLEVLIKAKTEQEQSRISKELEKFQDFKKILEF
ncbi:hypothetical protein U1Q18_052547 [Sarracenia purpurea var. burkii]